MQLHRKEYEIMTSNQLLQQEDFSESEAPHYDPGEEDKNFLPTAAD
jgi:hypothetical protein